MEIEELIRLRRRKGQSRPATCPVCGAEIYHLTNHVRQSAGGGHGRSGAYPSGWDKDSYQVIEKVEATLRS